LGMFQLQHAQSRKFVCFNRRKRITVRFEGDSLRCFFLERINELGYTEIESAWEPGLFLGFNSRGRFQDPSTYSEKRKCFSWTKLQRFVPNSEIHRCQRPPKKKTNHTLPMHQEHILRNMMRSSLLQKIRATHDGPYTLHNVTFL
uniref:Fibroblast growth factor n=1 Tax=Heligmosomoides polygyrus TaxID=6339 RepID=A0A183GJP9_HELPZ